MRIRQSYCTLLVSLISSAFFAACYGGDENAQEPWNDAADGAADEQLPEVAPANPEGAMHGVQLDAEQVAALQDAYDENPALSMEELGKLIGSQGMNRLQGFDSSAGNCSHISLTGNIDGTYAFTQRVYPSSGTALFGSITISTNGVGLKSSHSYSPSGASEKYTGDLNYLGWFASGHTMDGWMLTSNAYFCVGALFALW